MAQFARFFGAFGLMLGPDHTHTYLGIAPAAVPVRGSNRRGVSCVLESNDTCVAYSSVVPSPVQRDLEVCEERTFGWFSGLVGWSLLS